MMKFLANELTASPIFAQSFHKFLEDHQNTMSELYEKPSVSNFSKRR